MASRRVWTLRACPTPLLVSRFRSAAGRRAKGEGLKQKQNGWVKCATPHRLVVASNWSDTPLRPYRRRGLVRRGMCSQCPLLTRHRMGCSPVPRSRGTDPSICLLVSDRSLVVPSGHADVCIDWLRPGRRSGRRTTIRAMRQPMREPGRSGWAAATASASATAAAAALVRPTRGGPPSAARLAGLPRSSVDPRRMVTCSHERE